MKTRAEMAPLILALGLAGFVVMADNRVVSPIISFSQFKCCPSYLI